MKFCVSLLCLSIAVCLLVAPAAAQSPESPNQQTAGAAESLFVEALELMQAGSFESAAWKLERSATLDPQPGTLLNLATCYEELGRTASAWHTFRRAATVAARGGDSREAKAREAAERLEPRLTRLGVRVALDDRVPGLVVRRDGEEIDAKLYGEAFPVDPGPTRIVASAPDHVDWVRKVDVSPSLEPIWIDVPKLESTEPWAAVPESADVETPAPVDAPSPVVVPPADDATPTGPRRRGLPVASKVAGVIALVEFAGAAGLAAVAVATDRAGEGYCTTVECEPRGVTLKNRGVAYGTASGWVAAAGGITLGFAVGVAWESHRSGQGSGVALTWSPGVPGGGPQWR